MFKLRLQRPLTTDELDALRRLNTESDPDVLAEKVLVLSPAELEAWLSGEEDDEQAE